MKRFEPTSLGVVWAILIGLTLGSTVIAESVSHRAVLEIAIFCIAGAKAEFVLSYFMEVDRAEQCWARLFRCWIVLVSIMLIVGHLM